MEISSCNLKAGLMGKLGGLLFLPPAHLEGFASFLGLSLISVYVDQLANQCILVMQTGKKTSVTELERPFIYSPIGRCA